ncbi:MAG: tRNA (guanosine(37)-N1)-methyltransferase TrmD [Burkholderiaceae bacterium]|jgi:tRNA (guanine37-N1)-methyltransferase|nr:tRNA (guanosine(37)-N1)-methyltransferase TrmD [Burkholderiaceae bacterium]
MRFDIITLFPELFAPFMTAGVTRRAFDSGQIQVKLWQLRDFAEGAYRRVDDRPFGGGPGMVMLAEPLARCVEAIRADRAAQPDKPQDAPVALFSPAGRKLDHGAVEHWAASQGAILVCGRYEGIDQRFIDTHVTHQISLGDFVLSGGEIAALALLDAVARLQPGVLHDAASSRLDSFNPALDGLLDSPHYTRPEQWRGTSAPQALLSGHHAHIERWRREQSLVLTAAARPDLIAAARAAGHLSVRDEAYLQKINI